MNVDQAEGQQVFLHAAKAELALTWDALAIAAGMTTTQYRDVDKCGERVHQAYRVILS